MNGTLWGRRLKGAVSLGLLKGWRNTQDGVILEAPDGRKGEMRLCCGGGYTEDQERRDNDVASSEFLNLVGVSIEEVEDRLLLHWCDHCHTTQTLKRVCSRIEKRRAVVHNFLSSFKEYRACDSCISKSISLQDDAGRIAEMDAAEKLVVFRKKKKDISLGDITQEIIKILDAGFAFPASTELLRSAVKERNIKLEVDDGEGSSVSVVTDADYRRGSNNEIAMDGVVTLIWVTRSGHQVKITEAWEGIPCQKAEVRVEIGEDESSEFYPKVVEIFSKD